MTYGTKSNLGHDSRPFALQQNNIDKHITNRLHMKDTEKETQHRILWAPSLLTSCYCWKLAG